MASGSGSDTEGFEVSEILDKRGRGRNIEYLVRWDGYDEDEDSWEPASSLSHAHDAIDTYLGKGKVTKQLSKSLSTKAARSTTVTKTTSVLQEVQTSSLGRGGSRRSYQQESSYTSRGLGAGTQSESSSPEASPRLARRIKEQREDLKAVRDRLLGAAKIGVTDLSTKTRSQSGILNLNRQDLPIIVLITCLLFIALTFVVEQRK